MSSHAFVPWFEYVLEINLLALWNYTLFGINIEMNDFSFFLMWPVSGVGK